MKDELLPIFRQNYPRLFSDPELREIRCYAGWEDLLNALCHTLQTYLDASPQNPLVIVAVKEKWGELRVYCKGSDAFCRGAINMAAQMSLTVCEVCGQRGSLVGEQWVCVRCPQHIEWSR